MRLLGRRAAAGAAVVAADVGAAARAGQEAAMKRAVLAASLLVCGMARAGTAPTIITTASTFAIAGQAYHYADGDRVLASGDVPITWSAPIAPTGFQIDASTGTVTWTPTVGGDVNIQIDATNATGVTHQAFTVHVNAPPTITSSPVTSAVLNQVYLYQLTASGDPSISFGVATDSHGPIAPPGLVVD